ncbi:MAG: 50S ribosomal protein L15 [Pelolinea sp.]|nr:50S ribosomal protein L15 [Pelolinea sp.]
MKLNDLHPNEGSKKRKKRISRGIAAGQGKTGGRGTKGQHSRTGFGGHLARQGGKLPFYRSLPFMRGEGFTPVNRVEYNVINVGKLADFSAGSEVNPDIFAEKGMLHQKRNPVAILGGGEINKALTVKAHRFSQSAKEKIEAAGGKAELIEK